MNKMKQKIIIPAILMLMVPICAQAESDWDFRLTPYIWFAGVEGDVATVPGASVIPIDISASDALSDTEASFMLLFEAKTGQHGVLVDALYSDLQSDTDLIPEINLTLKSTSKTSIFLPLICMSSIKKNRLSWMCLPVHVTGKSIRNWSSVAA